MEKSIIDAASSNFTHSSPSRYYKHNEDTLKNTPQYIFEPELVVRESA